MNKPSRCINLPKLMIPTPYSHRESRDFGQRADGRLSSFLLPPASYSPSWAGPFQGRYDRAR